MAAASVAAVLAVGTVSVPSSFADGPKADDLKSKQRKVEKSIGHAHDELDHSSKRLTAASQRLEAARSQLATARNELAAARGRVAVAAERDAQMQAALTQAEADLAAAEAELVAGQQNMDEQAAEVASTVSDIYMEGDPQLLAFSSMLESASTDDLTRHE
jgi:chromosome segregation ATPase